LARVQQTNMEYRLALFKEVLGETTCRCCGSGERLELDHIVPIRRDAEARRVYGVNVVRRHPKQFQLLCRKCNGWKNDGPACPCKWWDTVSPGWRDRTSPLLSTISRSAPGHNTQVYRRSIQERDDHIVRLYVEDGMLQYEIAEEIGLSPQTIGQRLALRGVLEPRTFAKRAVRPITHSVGTDSVRE
jgi:hypothetical protein